MFWQNESATAKELVKIIEEEENEYQVRRCEEGIVSESVKLFSSEQRFWIVLISKLLLWQSGPQAVAFF